MQQYIIKGPPTSRQDRITFKVFSYQEKLNQPAVPFEFTTSFRTQTSGQNFQINESVGTEAKPINLVVENIGNIVVTNNVGKNYNNTTTEETVQKDNKKIVEVIYEDTLIGTISPRDFMKFCFLDYSKLKLRSRYETAFLTICVYPK